MHVWKIEAYYKGHKDQSDELAATLLVIAKTTNEAVGWITKFDRANPSLGFDRYDFADPVQIADNEGNTSCVVAFFEETVRQFC